MKKLRSLLALSLASAASAFAVPELQLDIVGGVYDPVDQTIVATSPSFTLRSLLKKMANNATNTSNLASLYYVSVAIEPGLVETDPDPDLGSFSFAGTTYTSSMLNWGIPPLNIPDVNPGDLAPHGVFPTYYAEISFYFSGTTVSAYNTQDDAPASGLLYYHDFLVDVTNLAPGYNLHFDLYDEKVKKGTYTIDDFAPFSHDASSGHHEVPDGSLTAILVCLAFLGFVGFPRRAARA